MKLGLIILVGLAVVLHSRYCLILLAAGEYSRFVLHCVAPSLA